MDETFCAHEPHRMAPVRQRPQCARSLNAGESIKALPTYLGHADPGFTLRTYTHLLPTSEDRTRRAIDTAFDEDQAAKDGPEAVDGLETA
ncbi:hypothetical protein ACLQ28_30325 [Micromonospora sp. DT201]|uniref:hypothetical protein n=1 Tax=Micromonospora sp. DT201 TaxID=3393442 RepID=UPI003CE7EB1C